MIYAKNAVAEDLKSPISEAFRALRTNLQFTGIDKKVKSILITSSQANEGKSTVAKNLAYSIALTENKIIVIDADLRNPTTHKAFNTSNSRGLTNILISELGYEGYIIKDTKYKNLDILPSGPIPPNPSELLASNKMKNLLTTLKDNYDYVLIDSPPVINVTDPVILAPFVDGVIFVIHAGKTEIDMILRSKEILEGVKANILGVVLNKVKESSGGYYYYAYYGNDNKHHEKRRKK